MTRVVERQKNKTRTSNDFKHNVHSQELAGTGCARARRFSQKRCKHNKRRASAGWPTEDASVLLSYAPPLLHLLGQLPTEAQQPPSHRSFRFGFSFALFKGDLEADTGPLLITGHVVGWRAWRNSALIPIAVLF